MNKFVWLLVLNFLASCSLLENFETKEKESSKSYAPQVSNRELWLNRSSDELLLHPIFASLPLERRKTTQGVEIFSFQNTGGSEITQTCDISAYYNSFFSSSTRKGSCQASRVEVKCSHIFYIFNNKISDYKRTGDCSEDRFDFRPYDKNDVPIMTDEERVYWNKIAKLKKDENAVCKITEDCATGKFCEEGICKNGGLWGQLINP